MGTGGPVSHGAVVAREYGIPAVAGASQSATRLRVNGESGEVTCLD